jgi:hypothetical protein
MSSRLFAQLNVRYNRSIEGTERGVIAFEVEELESLDCEVEATEVGLVVDAAAEVDAVITTARLKPELPSEREEKVRRK